MLILLSPSKTLDFSSPFPVQDNSIPRFVNESSYLVSLLKKLKKGEIADLMKISSTLAELNAQRYASWKYPFPEGHSRQAIIAFKGDVYDGLRVEEYSSANFRFANEHVRIISGLYGLLQPLDLIMPYRLEMGTPLKNRMGRDLYAFWTDLVSSEINIICREQKYKHVINLASAEYFRVINLKKVSSAFIQPVFKDYQKGEYKVVGLFAKRARGLLTSFIVKSEMSDIEHIKDFNKEGYSFSKKLSTAEQWVFTRKK